MWFRIQFHVDFLFMGFPVNGGILLLGDQAVLI